MLKWIVGYFVVGYLVSLLFFAVVGIRHGRRALPRYGNDDWGEDVGLGLLIVAFWPVAVFVMAVFVLMVLFAMVSMPFEKINMKKYLNPFYYLFGIPCSLIGRMIGK